MPKFPTILIVACLGFYGYTKYQSYSQTAAAALAAEEGTQSSESRLLQDPSPTSVSDQSDSEFRCDGRKFCSQMTSCAEAHYFLANCPGVEMDGGGDGVPCERQWCGN